ncbi:unnamed protein product [Closterium sp. NIES-65]|nr:unnamed protein product [Closterium sp. NIES-65]
MAAIQHLLQRALRPPCSLQSQLAGEAVRSSSHATPLRAVTKLPGLVRGQASASASAAASQRGAAAGGRAGGRGDSLRCSAQAAPGDAGAAQQQQREGEVLGQLRRILDPDLGADIVSCGFIKNLQVDEAEGAVTFDMELTTPACPVKDSFEAQAREYVGSLPWVKTVALTMTAQPPKPLVAEEVPRGLQRVANIIAVSSCKGGVGKSTVAVNLAYALHGMGAKVGIFDADIYGPSLPTMVSPELRVLRMDAETREIMPTEYLGVKLVSFGFAGQGSAIMRGPMVSGVINQLLTTTDWGELDYLVIDMPPGTGDIQLTLCQVVPLTAAVIVTTPQKLAFIDVAKGVRMFSKLKVPCVAVVENMAYFEADGKRYFPFGKGSGSEVVAQFGIPHLFELPIRPELSAAGDSGQPEVVEDPLGEVARTFTDVGACVVQQCAKLRQQVATAVLYDEALRALRVKLPGSDEEFFLHPATVRRNDRSAQSIDEWTGEQKLQYSDVSDDIIPESVRPMGNYAVSIVWPDGFSQVAPFDQLEEMERIVDVEGRREAVAAFKEQESRAGAADVAPAPTSAIRESAWRLNRAWRNGGENAHLTAPSRENSGEFATPTADGSAVYIVRLNAAPPLCEYHGGIVGYPATATWDDGSDEEDSEAVPQMILPAGNSAAAVGGETVDLDDTDGDQLLSNTTAPSPPANGTSDAAATPSARGGHGGSGNGNGGRNGGGGYPRHRLSLSMDRPQVAAFAGLLQRQQAQVASEAGVPEDGLLYSYKHTSNGFAARLMARQLWRLRRHPAVASVRASRVFRRQTSDSPQFLGLPGKVWPAVGGQSKAGEGTVVGIVDTGIWPEHPSFSDKGLSSQLPAGWKGKCEQSSSFRCNNKVIGAKAFYAGFQQSSGKPVLTNDWLSPRDADGHGTWCAGAAAGNPVKVKGGGQVSGMVPAARIAAYKVFWTDGNGDMYATEPDIIAAVNQGVADGVDVLSLSLGGVNPEDNYFNDLSFMRANTAGVFVTFAAGNAGPPGRGGFYRTLDNFAPFYLTVGASTIARGGASLASSTAGAQSLSHGATTSTNGTDGSTSGNFNGNGTDGSSSTVLTTDGGITFTTASSSAPVVADFSSRGPLLQPSATAQPPKPGNAIMKPDIIGPGVDLVAAAPGNQPGDPDALARMSSTSMATPHLAGLAALIIQKYPNWTPAQVMSALMTMARVTDTSKSAIKSATGGEATPWEMGAGHVFPPAMLDPGLTYDARDRDYQNFLAGQDLNRAKKEFPGAALSPLAVRNLNLPTITLPRLQGSLQVTRTVTNVGQTRSTYSVSGKPPQGVKVTVGPRSLTLAPEEKGTYTVTVTVDTPSNDFKYGYLVWADDQGHSVRSPIVVQPISR